MPTPAPTAARPGRGSYPAGSLQTDVYGARSTDGGLTFQNFRLSQSPFVPYPQGFLGDYTNIAAAATADFSLQAYPSPARELLHVALTLPAPAPVLLTLRDVLGRPVRQQQYPATTAAAQLTLPVLDLPPGPYTLEARMGAQRLFRRVLVQP